MKLLVVFVTCVLVEVFGQPSYCVKNEEITLEREATKDYTCNIADDGDLLTYVIEPQEGYEASRFKVHHYAGRECNRAMPEAIEDNSCFDSVPYCTLYDKILEDIGNVTKSCLDIQCVGNQDCKLDVFIEYIPDNFKPLKPASTICYASDYNYTLLDNSWRTFYCSGNHGLTNKAKLDYYVESRSGDRFKTYYAEGNNCNRFPSNLVASQYVSGSSCTTATDECIKSKKSVTSNNGACVMVLCDEPTGCLLEYDIEFYFEYSYGRQVRFEVDTPYIALDPDDRGLFYKVTKREHGLEFGDKFSMDIRLAAGADDDKFTAWHATGRDCDQGFFMSESQAISFSSCKNDVSKCTETDTVTDDQECVLIKCANWFFDCELDLHIEWTSGASQGSLLMLVATVLMALYL